MENNSQPLFEVTLISHYVSKIQVRANSAEDAKSAVLNSGLGIEETPPRILFVYCKDIRQLS